MVPCPDLDSTRVRTLKFKKNSNLRALDSLRNSKMLFKRITFQNYVCKNVKIELPCQSTGLKIHNYVSSQNSNLHDLKPEKLNLPTSQIFEINWFKLDISLTLGHGLCLVSLKWSAIFSYTSWTWIFSNLSAVALSIWLIWALFCDGQCFGNWQVHERSMLFRKVNEILSCLGRKVNICLSLKESFLDVKVTRIWKLTHAARKQCLLFWLKFHA